MAGRIRTLKPEYLEDERTAKLSHEAARLFVGLVLVADDFGNFRANESQLHGAIFWATPSNRGIASLLDELSRSDADGNSGLVTLYIVRGERFGHLNGWAKNQRVDKPGKPRVPFLKEGKIIGQFDNSRTVRDLFASDSGIIRTGSDPITDPIRSDHRSTMTTSDARAREEQAPRQTSLTPAELALLTTADADARSRNGMTRQPSSLGNLIASDLENHHQEFSTSESEKK